MRVIEQFRTEGYIHVPPVREFVGVGVSEGQAVVFFIVEKDWYTEGDFDTFDWLRFSTVEPGYGIPTGDYLGHVDIGGKHVFVYA